MLKSGKAAGSGDPVSIDGSILEGGGQIIRISAALACLLRQPVALHSIRAKRSKPGLRAQHLTGLGLVVEMSQGNLVGGGVGATEVQLHPGQLQGGRFQADPGTAGSVALLIQVSLPCALFAPRPTRLQLRGGTNADMAPPVDYIQQVFCPISKRFGVDCDVSIVKRGFFPRGGGIVDVNVQPVAQLSAVEMLDPGHVVRITGTAICAGELPRGYGNDIAKACQRLLLNRHKELVADVKIDIAGEYIQRDQATATGSCVLLVAETSTGCLLAGSGLGSRGKGPRDIAADAVDMLTNNLQHGACVDEHLQDQLIILMALAKGTSRIRTGPLTLHTQTAIELCKNLLGVNFDVTPVDGVADANVVSCQGLEFSRSM
eukprot:scpid60708/ scgid15325/ RNA 3&apos; RNA terminal phosphate cyclase domain-containing protein 1